MTGVQTCALPISLVGFNHQGVSHLSGISSLLGVEAASGNLAAASHLLSILLSFMLGAAISGFTIGNTSLKLGRRYGAALLLEAALLLLALHFLKQGASSGHYLAATACGLQNAMTSSYSGAVVRTTHVTGMFTDISIMIGLWFRGQRADKRRLALYSILITGFIAGGILGALFFNYIHFNALALPAFLAALMAFIYFGYWLKQQA